MNLLGTGISTDNDGPVISLRQVLDTWKYQGARAGLKAAGYLIAFGLGGVAACVAVGLLRRGKQD
jgi:hypothetical protein